MPDTPPANTPWKQRIVIAFAIALLIVGAVIWNSTRQKAALIPHIPQLLAPAVPEDCRQVVLVLSPEARSVPARLWMLERGAANELWHTASGPIPVSLGRNGLAWGDGEHSMSEPEKFPIKYEGDGCSPAGVFRIPFAFGYTPASEASRVRLRYVPVTETLVGVDDVNSEYYNKVIDASTVTRDWESNETMLRPDGLYRWGAFIAHNPRGEPGLGSCIFFHLWSGPGRPTAGCTAMDEKDVVALLSWLDPEKEPRLIQGLESW